MITQETLKKIKCAVHYPLDWEDYNSTFVRDNTNCYAHAIGSTFPERKAYGMIGRLSSKKQKGSYSSKEELKELFLADISILELQFEEIPFENKWIFFEKINNMELAENEHIAVLFAVHARIGRKIDDFHFLRYDKEMGWSEKRWYLNPYIFEDIFKEWPSSDKSELVGIFKITR